MMLRVYPGRTWKVRSAQTDEQGSGTVTLYDPTRGAYESKKSKQGTGQIFIRIQEPGVRIQNSESRS